MREAVRYIAQDDPEAARQMASSILESVEKLPSFPESHRMIPELEREDLREFFQGRYRIVYRIAGDAIHILTVRHMRRELDPAEVEGNT